MKFLRIATLAVVLLAIAVESRAQQISRFEVDEFPESGHALGSLRLFTRLAVENKYDDNIFAVPRDTKGDYFVSFVPAGLLETTWSRHYLSVGAFGRIHRYPSRSSEDSEEWEVSWTGRLDRNDESSLGGIASGGRRTLDRADPENSGRRKPQQVDYFESELSYLHELGRFELELNPVFDFLDFVDTLDNDRDRIEFGGTSRISYRQSPSLALLCAPGALVADYEREVDDVGLERDGFAIDVLCGVDLDFGAMFSAELAVGVVHVNFEESSFDHVTTVAFEGDAFWDVTQLTQVRAEVSRSVVPSDLEGASSKTRTEAILGVRHELLRNVILTTDVGYLREKFHDLGRDDDRFRARAGIEYRMNRFLSFVADYDFQFRSSSSPEDFTRNIVGLTVQLRL